MEETPYLRGALLLDHEVEGEGDEELAETVYEAEYYGV